MNGRGQCPFLVFASAPFLPSSLCFNVVPAEDSALCEGLAWLSGCVSKTPDVGVAATWRALACVMLRQLTSDHRLFDSHSMSRNLPAARSKE